MTLRIQWTLNSTLHSTTYNYNSIFITILLHLFCPYTVTVCSQRPGCTQYTDCWGRYIESVWFWSSKGDLPLNVQNVHKGEFAVAILFDPSQFPFDRQIVGYILINTLCTHVCVLCMIKVYGGEGLGQHPLNYICTAVFFFLSPHRKWSQSCSIKHLAKPHALLNTLSTTVSVDWAVVALLFSFCY